MASMANGKGNGLRIGGAKGTGQWVGPRTMGKGKGKGKGIGTGCGQCNANCVGVQECILVDATSNEPIMTISQNDVLDLEELNRVSSTMEYAIECVTFGQVVSTSISAVSSGLNMRTTDNTRPWTLSGDLNGDYFPTPLSPGSYTVTCQPFCGLDANGATSGPEQISFEIVDSDSLDRLTQAPAVSPPGPPDSSGPTTTAPSLRPTVAAQTASPTTACGRGRLFVTGFSLVNADLVANSQTAQDASVLRAVEDGDELSMTSIRAEFGQDTNFTIICHTNPSSFAALPFIVGSTGMRDNFVSNFESEQRAGVNDPSQEGYYNVENNPPWTLADDDRGIYNPTDFDNNLGEWTVSCRAFCETNLGFGRGVNSRGRPNPDADPFSSTEESVTFTVVE